MMVCDVITLPPERQAELLNTIIKSMLEKSRGRCVTITGKRLFRIAGLRVPPSYRIMIYNCFFEELAKHGNAISVNGSRWVLAGVYSKRNKWAVLHFVRVE